jgi:hypothetical protein
LTTAAPRHSGRAAESQEISLEYSERYVKHSFQESRGGISKVAHLAT